MPSDILDIDPTKKYMAFYVGPNGSGKSIAIASWMALGSVYFFDYDGRMNSVANWYKQRGLKSGQLLYDTYGPENLYDAIEKLREFTSSCPHAAIVIDSFTAATITAVTFSMYRRMAGGQGSKNYPKITKGEMPVPDWDEWNGETMYVTMMLDMCKQIASSGTAVFWTGHPVERMKIEEVQGRQSITYQTKFAAFGHKSDSLIPIYFNEIYGFTSEIDVSNGKVYKVCRTQPYAQIIAKTALNLPAKLDWTDKNFREIFLQNIGKKEQEIPKTSLAF